VGFLGEMETQHTWIDDRLPTEDDVNEYGHIIKPDRKSANGWYPCDTQGMELGDPWARVLTMPIWVRSNRVPPLLNYWDKVSDFPRLCWLMVEFGECFLVCDPSYFLSGKGPSLKDCRWMSRPFDNFNEGATCNKSWK